MVDQEWLEQRPLVKVLYPEDPNDADTVTEGIWVLPLVGDENEGAGIIVNQSVSGPDRFDWGDLATWISPSPLTQKAEVVGSKSYLKQSFADARVEELVGAAVAFHEQHATLRRERVKTMFVSTCDRCGRPGIGRLLPDEVWRSAIPPELHEKTLCNPCIDELISANVKRKAPARFAFWRRRAR